MLKKISLTLLLGLLAGASALRSQVLVDFSSFESPTTLFYGEWSITSDPFTGSLVAASGISQVSGAYQFDEVTNIDQAYVEKSFSTALNLSGSDQLSLGLRVLEGNTAGSITLSLFDSAANSASVTFLLSDFSSSSFSVVSSLWTLAGSFDASAVTLFRLSGNDAFGSGLLAIEVSQLSATSSTTVPIDPPTTAVPEPATYGLGGAFALLALGGVRRLRRPAKTL